MPNIVLSIIIPVYNVEQYINQCIESILIQTYHDYEIILIDDGSTDSSGEICDTYAQKDSRVKVVHKINGGVSSARNIGLQMIKGKYLTFIDPDDFINIDTYEENMNIMINNSEIDILQYPFCKLHSTKYVETPTNNCQYIKGTEAIFSNWWSGSPIHYSIWNKIFKKEIFNHITFLEGHVSEDTRLLVDFCKKSLWHLQNIKNERALHKIQKVGNDMATVLISAFCSALHSNNSSAAKVMRICE